VLAERIAALHFSASLTASPNYCDFMKASLCIQYVGSNVSSSRVDSLNFISLSFPFLRLLLKACPIYGVLLLTDNMIYACSYVFRIILLAEQIDLSGEVLTYVREVHGSNLGRSIDLDF
jgi:hypothetical protein